MKNKRDWTEEFDAMVTREGLDEGLISNSAVIWFLGTLKSQGAKLRNEKDTNKKLDLLASMIITSASITTLNSDVGTGLSGKLKGLVSAFL